MRYLWLGLQGEVIGIDSVVGAEEAGEIRGIEGRPREKDLSPRTSTKGASTVSIVELLRNDLTGGISAGGAWLMFLLMERRLPLSQEPEH